MMDAVLYWMGVATLGVLVIIGAVRVVWVLILAYCRVLRNADRLLDYHAAWVREQKRREREFW